jgi:hypothetical protein
MERTCETPFQWKELVKCRFMERTCEMPFMGIAEGSLPNPADISQKPNDGSGET